MGIRTYHDSPRADKAMLSHDLMTGPCKFEIIVDPVLFCPIPGKLHDLRLFDRRRRRVMVGDDHNLFWIPDLVFDLFHMLCDLHTGTQDIIHHCPVYIYPYDIARMHTFFSGRPGKDFF